MLNPGDEVIIFEPFYGYHVNTLKALDITPIYCRLELPEGNVCFEALEKLFSQRTKAILINTPANPSGKIFSRREIEMIGELACKHDVFIFTDEIYEHFVYDGLEHVSPASLSKFKERTISIFGCSKTFSVTGWRIGYCVCDEKWKEAIGCMNDLIYVCAPAPLQVGVAQGMRELSMEYYENIREKFQTTRDRICSALDEGGFKPMVPKGAYYVLADASFVPGRSSKEKAMRVLKESSIASVPGCAFYHDNAGDDLLRFCFAKDDATIEKALKKLSAMKRCRLS